MCILTHYYILTSACDHAYLNLKRNLHIPWFFPHHRFVLVCLQLAILKSYSMSSDNAVMIAWASMHRFLTNDTDQYSIALRPKWSIEDVY